MNTAMFPRPAPTSDNMTGSNGQDVDPEELLAAATEAIAAGEAEGTRLRLLGGIGVFHLAQSARRLPLSRAYHDFDVVVGPRQGTAAAKVFRRLGYGEDAHFNALHGAQRMIFNAPGGFVVDVLVGTFQMCHRLELGRDLPVEALTVHPADLLLTKLQIVEIEDKDYRDTTALLLDLPIGDGSRAIDPARFVAPLAADWGFHHTVERNLPRVVEYAHAKLDSGRAADVAASADLLRQAMDAAPKPLKWKIRARVGEKVAWYELPEEI